MTLERPDHRRASRRSTTRRCPSTSTSSGLIYGLDVDAEGKVAMRMTLTAPNCPGGGQPARRKWSARCARVPGVTDVKLELTFDPPWTKDRMSEAAKLALGIEDIIPIARLRR